MEKYDFPKSESKGVFLSFRPERSGAEKSLDSSTSLGMTVGKTLLGMTVGKTSLGKTEGKPVLGMTVGKTLLGMTVGKPVLGMTVGKPALGMPEGKPALGMTGLIPCTEGTIFRNRRARVFSCHFDRSEAERRNL